jgi:hypothetical protein
MVKLAPNKTAARGVSDLDGVWAAEFVPIASLDDTNHNLTTAQTVNKHKFFTVLSI